MSTTWTNIQIVGKPSYTQIPDIPTLWTPLLSFTTGGFGFGQGGFGQGGFGGGQTQTGTAQPVWTAWSTD